jgi:hypothetical protein
MRHRLLGPSFSGQINDSKTKVCRLEWGILDLSEPYVSALLSSSSSSSCEKPRASEGDKAIPSIDTGRRKGFRNTKEDTAGRVFHAADIIQQSGVLLPLLRLELEICIN